ncbi:MAG: Ig-like domain-containing protein [Bacteroidales bacterium]|nr:Ig-like domain-containing protein [Clostridium sp.]MCM1202575.1 Ig-like domain-containing protein [Bacteroidales bacterium]
MGDGTRRRETGAGSPALFSGRRQWLRRGLSVVLALLMVFGGPMEALAAGTTYTVYLYDSVREEDEEHSSPHGYLYGKQEVEEGSFIVEPEAKVDGYIFMGWYDNKMTNGGIINGKKLDLTQPVETVVGSLAQPWIYACYVEERTASNTIVVTDGYAGDVTIYNQQHKDNTTDVRKWFMFTPETSGEYTFACKSGNTQWHWLDTDYQVTGVGETFTAPAVESTRKFTKVLEAGKTYYWYLLYYNSNSKTTSQFNEQISVSSQAKKDISTLTYTPKTIANQTYTGSEIKPKVTIKDGTTTLNEGTDYTVAYKNNINANANTKATMTITAVNGSAYTGKMELQFTIVQAANPPVSPSTTMEAAENAETVSDVALPDGWSWSSADKDKALVSGQAVKAVAEYQDKSNYKNSTVTVSITRKQGVVTKKEISTLTFSAIPEQTYTGSAITPSITVKDGTKTLTKGTDYTLEYANNINASTGNVQASITIKAVEGSDYSGSVTQYFKIAKADNPPNVPATVMEAEYNVKTVGAVELPSGWSWSSTDRNKALVSGQKVEAAAEYTGQDRANFNNVKVTVGITRKMPVITDFSISEGRKDLRVGENCTLEVSRIKPEDADFSVDWNTVWSSNDTGVATVDDSGKVTAVSSGTAVITAKIQEISRTCTIVVTNGVTDFTLNKQELSLKGGAKERLSITTTPANPDAYKVMWSSNNEEIATVDGNGMVTAAGSGQATITATINGISKACSVTVTNPLSAFTLNKETLTLTAGNAETLFEKEKTPENADAYTITWSSDNSGVATVSDAGKITAVSAGTAVITASVNNGTQVITRSCQVTVNAATETLTGILVDPESMALKAGESGVIVVTPNPAGAAIGEITYQSDNTSVAEVNPDTGKVTAKASGTAKITVSAGGYTKDCNVTVTNPVTGFSLNKTAATMKIGDTDVLSVTTVPAAPDAYTVQWASSAPGIVTVDGQGNIEAKASGTAVITAVINGMSRRCTITVEDREPVLTTGITLDAAEKTVDKGESFALQITAVTPDNADNQEVAWVSSDASVASVAAGGEKSGTVTGVSAGQAVIMAIAKDGSGVTASCTVTVNPILVTGIILEEEEKSIRKEESFQLTVRTILPDNADNRKVFWSSSDYGIATVDEDGTVTGVSAGEAVITATAKDGSGISASCRVTVIQESKQPVQVTEITLNAAEKTIKKNESFQLTAAKVLPDDADNREIEWSSSNSKVAMVDGNGKVTGVSAGTAVITAKAKDGSGVTASCKVTVTENNPGGGSAIKVTSLKITGPTKKVAPGKKIKLTAAVYPKNAANKQVTWKVSNKKYASVNRQGVVTTKKAGKGRKVTITAVSAEDNRIKAVYKISIMKNAVKKIKLTGKKTLKVGKSTKLKAKFTPAKGISKELTWTSSNKKVAAVNAKGKVTAKKKGKAKITAKAKDGSGKKASITIKVK